MRSRADHLVAHAMQRLKIGLLLALDLAKPLHRPRSGSAIAFIVMSLLFDTLGFTNCAGIRRTLCPSACSQPY
ncbi:MULTISPECIES: hypothetical protein [unclassified Mesorhizobium]|uniref:hypothetical protein n=1 Tax=unclassified Mesorhizobium TaxID=325217 RepID=UPI001FDF29FD|nr:MULTISPECIES: hypothetical protein [unclassified Mesorhizobium]